MVHQFRNWVIGEYPDLASLSVGLKRATWGLSTGFLYVDPTWGGLLLVNDSFTEDSICEYAVFAPKPGILPLVAGQRYVIQQVESLTTDWYETTEQLRQQLQELLEGGGMLLGYNPIYVEWLGKGH